MRARKSAFAVDTETGLLAPAAQYPSPNCDDRPAATTVDLIVIHCISLPPGEYGAQYIQEFFCNTLDCSAHPYFMEIADLTVSSHLLIDRRGAVAQFVPLHLRAWHAGESCFGKRESCNDFSIGIELEGSEQSEFEDAQYVTLNGVIRALRSAYASLRAAPVVGHSDIAPGRKSDPGSGFDWTRLDAGSGQNP